MLHESATKIKQHGHQVQTIAEKQSLEFELKQMALSSTIQ